MKYQLAVYRNQDGSPMKDSNSRMKFVTVKRLGQTYYTMINEQGKHQYVTKDQILKNIKNFTNVGVSNNQIYPKVDKLEKEAIKMQQRKQNPKDVSYFVGTESVNGELRLAKYVWEDDKARKEYHVIHGVQKARGKYVIELNLASEDEIKDNINLAANVGIDSNGKVYPRTSSQPEIQDKEQRLRVGYEKALRTIDYSKMDLSVNESKYKAGVIEFEVLVNTNTGERFYSAQAPSTDRSIREINFLIPVAKAAPYVEQIRREIR